MYHPWRALRHLGDEWTLVWAPLAGVVDKLGRTNWHDRTITLDPDQDQAQRRSTLAHELVHVERGPIGNVHYRPREERLVDAVAARRLIGIRDLGEALAWAHNLAEAADELWVDESMLRARLEHLHPAERHYLRRRLQEEQTQPHPEPEAEVS